MIDFINTGGAKQLKDSRFTDIMPENLSGQIETQAFAYALARQVEKLCVFADRARIYASIEFVPERLLDILAVELRTPAYHDNYPVSVKRELVAGTLPFYQRLGTPAAVEWIIRAIFGEGRIEEWYEYGGEPHHFRVYVTRDHTATSWEEFWQFLEAVGLVKRLSSWLDDIITTLHPISSTLHVGGTMSAAAYLPTPEMEDRVDFHSELRVGCTLSAVTCIPIPQQRDSFCFQSTLRTGGQTAARTYIPIPEVQKGGDSRS